jgi:hypothetical protein
VVSIPFSRKKHYLTGVDWIVRGFDYMNRRATGSGNMFQIVMELEGVPAEDDVRDALGRFMGKFPVVNGRTRRDYNLAPYWKLPSRAWKNQPQLKVHHLENGEGVSDILERGVNTPFVSKREHIVFHLIYSGENSQFAATFDHCLFDAHGAEAFLRMFQQEWEKNGSCSWESPPPEPAHLSEWRRKFEAGRNVNRAFLRLAEGAPPRVLPRVAASHKQAFKFSVVSFGEQQSKKILERAESEAGYFMLMPYTMALTAQILHEIFVKKGVDTGDYIIPVTLDTRAPSEGAEEVFFNHVSFLLFRIGAQEVADLPVLLRSIKQQLYDQVKAGLPQDIREASLLMRIVPLPILSYLMGIYLKGEVASFCFSFVGGAGDGLTHFMGNQVRRSYHMTRVPISPGLGVFFQQSRGGLNAYVSYAEGLLGEDEVKMIVESLKSRLGG